MFFFSFSPFTQQENEHVGTERSEKEREKKIFFFNHMQRRL
jgi:hypothetical protein